MELERALPTQLEREALPWEAAFLAGKACDGREGLAAARLLHRAHGAVTGRALLIRDASCYRRMFPRLKVIAP